MERQACKIAESLGRDPAEWKREQSMASPGPELIDAVCTMSDYHRKWASYEMLRKQRLADETPLKNQPLRGIGVSLVYQGTGFLASGADKGYFGVEMTLEKDGSLEIRTSAVACSQETAALWRRIAADQLALDAGMVRIGQNSTDMVPDSGPSSLSRNISVITRLIERSCAAIKKQRFRDPLPITVQRSYKPAKASKEQDFHVDGAAFNQLGWGVVVVEAEIDPIDYSPRVRGVWMMVDGGRILSERKARSSLKISIGQALSWASREHIQYTQGSLSSMDAFLYDIPSVEDDPPIHIDFFLNDGALAKGIGELPFSCVPAAFAQAVSQAAGPSFDILPITANMVRESLLRNAEPGEAGTP
jgi:CO/xanthine dehydrogenase Mo-binding subunit